MSPLESLALLVADLNSQVRRLQEENARMASERDDLLQRIDHHVPGD